MILVDTDRWIDHFRASDPFLTSALQAHVCGTHAWILGELDLGGGIPPRIRRELGALGRATPVDAESMLAFVAARKLSGLGLQWVDVQLVMCALRDDLAIDTRDAAVRETLRRLGGRGDPRSGSST